MRPRIFRALDRNKNEWITLTFNEILNGETSAWTDIDNETISEATQFSDIDNTVIFEGDILSCRFMIDYSVFRDPEIVVVKFESGQYTPMTLKKYTEYKTWPHYYDYKIIGNIYENPEVYDKKRN